MSQILRIHPGNPQPRLIAQAAARATNGGVIVYPTDSCYALGCVVSNKHGQDMMRLIRNIEPKHDFTLVCKNLSEVSRYAKFGNPTFRLIKSLTPGPYTFILKATHEVPKRLQNPKRKTIGIRIPDNPIALSLLENLEEPLLNTTLWMPGDEQPLNDPDEILERIGKQVDLVIDGGICAMEPTTVVNLETDVPQVVRAGLGDVSVFN